MPKGTMRGFSVESHSGKVFPHVEEIMDGKAECVQRPGNRTDTSQSAETRITQNCPHLYRHSHITNDDDDDDYNFLITQLRLV